MRQRAMIAMALSCNPSILIADEPTTALDVTTQAQILDLLRRLQRENGMAIIFITHDLGVIAEMADDVVVMYLGEWSRAGPWTIFFMRQTSLHAVVVAIDPAYPSHTRERLASIAGSVPHPYARPSGCLFHPRCPALMPGHCDSTTRFEPVAPDHAVSCFLYDGA